LTLQDRETKRVLVVEAENGNGKWWLGC